MFKWLRSQQNFEKVADSYAITRTRVNEAIIDLALDQIKRGRTPLIISHFPDTYTQLESAFAERAIVIDVCDASDFSSLLSELIEQPQGKPIFCWSGIFCEDSDTIDRPFIEKPLSAIVSERHPDVEVDSKVIDYLRGCARNVRIGWYASFDDELVQYCVGENGIQLMKLLGMKRDDVITSELLSRKMDRTLMSRRLIIDSDGSLCGSAGEWITRNFRKR